VKNLFARIFRRWGAEFFQQAATRRKAATGDPFALQELAQAALNREEMDEAKQLIEQALAIAPDKASLHVTQAAVLRRQEDFPAARAALQTALQLAPGHARALTNLAEIELLHGQAAQALEKIDAALAAEPKLLPAQVNRVAALSETGRHEEARADGERLLKRHPDHPELLLNTANALLQLGRGRKAVEMLRHAIKCRPDFPAADYLLATLVGDVAALQPALDYLEKRLAREGETLGLLTTLANGHQAAGHLSRAREIAYRILAREPDHIAALMVLANCSSSSGHAEISDGFYGSLFARSGDLTGMASNWLFEGNYLPHLPPAALFERHRAWADKFAETANLPGEARPQGGPLHRDPLRIGYVSGDFCAHPVGSLLLEIIRRHERKAFMPIAFSTTLREDGMTQELKRAFAVWHDIFDLDDDALAALFSKEKIDVLVDLSGHTAFHRLRIFARRVAPVQVTWIGYFHSTGLANIDYLLTDPHTSPRECGQFFSETPIHLGSTRFCFFPPPHAPDVAPPPGATGRPFTFGCFNRLAKINDEVIEAWSEILRRTPRTRLWLKAGALKDAGVCADLRERFRAAGVLDERLILRPGSAHREMLDEFSMLDLCLDPFPFTGGAPSLESFWMGVPTLTVPGATMVSRQTHAMNVNLGLEQHLSASGVRDYIERAVGFANHPRPLWQWRGELRQRMAQSPLCDGDGFTRRLESFYRAAHDAASEGRHLPAYFVE